MKVKKSPASAKKPRTWQRQCVVCGTVFRDSGNQPICRATACQTELRSQRNAKSLGKLTDSPYYPAARAAYAAYVARCQRLGVPYGGDMDEYHYCRDYIESVEADERLAQTGPTDEPVAPAPNYYSSASPITWNHATVRDEEAA